MITLKTVITQYAEKLTQRYGQQLLPGQRKALDAILACRSHCGSLIAQCHTCAQNQVIPLSCGHRNCPQCQSHLGEQWCQRQQEKLLPVTYFMVTFTLPYELRNVAWQHQHIVYECLCQAAAETLQTIGKNNHQMSFGMSTVLHTHKRDKGYHPHVHVVLPGGGLSLDGQTWKTLPQKFLVNERALAKVFRGILLSKLIEQSIPFPSGLPKQWVAHIKNVGQGEKALEYLSRYLYRGIINEYDILNNHEGHITFRYRDSETQEFTNRTLPGETFLWYLLKHVLPRGFRRVRDYGFLHGNAKKTLLRIQQLLQVKLRKKVEDKKALCCRTCQSIMTIVHIMAEKIPMRFRFYSAANDTGQPIPPT